jgi:hypothetical protein
MGVVYEAFDSARQDTVALKLMARGEPGALYRFKNEFRALADLRHPNLVQLYELISADEQWLLTMEFVAGVDFLHYVRPGGEQPGIGGEGDTEVEAALDRETYETAALSSLAAQPPSLRVRRISHGALDEQRLRSALRQLAEGVVGLHAHRRLHLDIKPSNVLVEAGGRVALCDFGLARRLDPGELEATAEEGLVGTVSHMSPEQAARKPLTEASDWYSVGVLLYQSLTGALPYDGEAEQVLVRKQALPPASPEQRNATAPPDLARLCMRLLAIRAEDRPSGHEILAELGASGVSPPRAGLTSTRGRPFVGRDAELDRLREAAEAVGDGQTVTVLVHGPSGVGKSALVDRFLSELREDDDTVILRGRCYEHEQVPYKAFDSIVDELAGLLARRSNEEVEPLLPRDVGSLSRLFPVLQRVRAIAAPALPSPPVRDPKESRRRAFAALRGLLGRLGERRRLVLCIDDLQWGDRDSGRLLRELMHPPSSPRLLLVGTYRSDEARDSPMLSLLVDRAGRLRLPGARELRIEELTREQATALAEKLLGSASSRLARAVARESRGNPFFVAELVRYVRGGATLGDGSSDGELRLDDVLAHRIGRLAPAPRALLTAIAMAGQPVDLRVLVRAAEAGGELRGALALLRVDNLARTLRVHDREAVEAYHDRIRQAALARIDSEERRDWHRRLAEAYELVGRAEPEVLLNHWRGAGDERRAADYAERAGDHAAAAFAFDRAVQMYQLALTLGAGAERDRERSLQARLGDALAHAGRGSDAAEVYAAAAAGAQAADRLELRRRAAEQLLYTGHLTRGREAIREVLAEVGVRMAASPRAALVSLAWGRLRARLRGFAYARRDPSQVSPERLTQVDILWSASTGLSMIDTIQGGDFQTRHLRLALATGEPFRVARSLSMEAAYSATRGARSRARSERLADEALRINEELGDPHGIAFSLLIKGVVAYLRGEWMRAWEYSTRAEQLFRDRCVGAAWELTNAMVYSVSALSYLGDINMLRRVMPDRLREAEEYGNLYMINWMRSGTSNMLWLSDDDTETAERQVELAERQWTNPGFQVQHYYFLWSRCQIALYRGDARAAWAHVQSVWPRLASSLLLRVRYVELQAYHLRARCAVASALHEPSRRLVRQTRRDARVIAAEAMPWAAGIAASLRAGADAVGGRLERAARRLDEASACFEAAGMRLHAACARLQRTRLGGDASAIEVAAQAVSNLGVRAPHRMADVLVPSVPRRLALVAAS